MRLIKLIFATGVSFLIFVFVYSRIYNGCGGSDERHKKVARNTLHALFLACWDYQQTYGFFPMGSVSDKDLVKKTTESGGLTVISALLGREGSQMENSKLHQFGHFYSSEINKGGIKTTSISTKLLDPWGNPYHLLFDYDQDGKLVEPFTGEIIHNEGILIWSNGPDGKSGTPETNEDNIYAWK